MNNKVVCIIPARAGSKRIKGKNTILFAGKPIIEHALTAAIDSLLFDEIIILTDDEAIINKYPEYSKRRTAESATDTATLTDAVLSMGKPYLSQCDKICLLLPTAVFTKDDDLIKAYKISKTREAVVSLSRYNHPIERAFVLNGTAAKMANSKLMFSRTQDIKEYYHDAGQFYWIDAKAFLRQKKIYMDDLGYYKMNGCIDIDEIEDIKKAEAMYGTK